MTRTQTRMRAETCATYVERVNLAIDYISARLHRKLKLEEVARAGMLSPFHFHRVFQGIVGETPGDYVKRLRLYRAVAMMGGVGHSRRPASVTEIASRCGFASISDFSRAFKARFGAAPSRFDLAAWQTAHRAEFDAMAAQSEWNRRGAERGGGAGAATGHVKELPPEPRQPRDGFRVEIRDRPAREVAYIRVRDPYRPGAVLAATERLVAWAERHGCADNQWLGYQWENPELVSLAQCQYHVAVEARGFAARGEVGRYRFPPMVVATVEIRGGIDLEINALRWLYGAWLPRSGYVPDDQPGFEAWIGRPFAHGTEHFELRVEIPVRRE